MLRGWVVVGAAKSDFVARPLTLTLSPNRFAGEREMEADAWSRLRGAEAFAACSLSPAKRLGERVRVKIGRAHV